VDGPRHGCEEIIIIIICLVSRPAVLLLKVGLSELPDPLNAGESYLAI
jgi:hypothetical protein